MAHDTPVTELTDEEIVRRLIIDVQKARSNLMELGEDMERLAEVTNPWLFGPTNIIRALEMYEKRGTSPTTAEVMNLLIIADREPLIGISAHFYFPIPTAEEYLTARRMS